mgnify:FL=1
MQPLPQIKTDTNRADRSQLDAGWRRYIGGFVTKTTSAGPVLHPNLRLAWGGHHLFGPGKADLLEGIAVTGSIAQAASRMKMSYMKAWLLIQHLEERIRTPLVQKSRGGTRGGGAALTPAGRALLAAYRAIEADCQRAAKKHLKRIARHIDAH